MLRKFFSGMFGSRPAPKDPAPKDPASKDRPTLEELLEGITPENVHPEIGTGPAVGNEFPNGYEETNSPAELELIREQLVNGNAVMAEAARDRGYSLHPRIAERAASKGAEVPVSSTAAAEAVAEITLAGAGDIVKTRKVTMQVGDIDGVTHVLTTAAGLSSSQLDKPDGLSKRIQALPGVSFVQAKNLGGARKQLLVKVEGNIAETIAALEAIVANDKRFQ